MSRTRYLCNLYGLEETLEAFSPQNAAVAMVNNSFRNGALDVLDFKHGLYVDVWEHPEGQEEALESTFKTFIVNAAALIHINSVEEVQRT